MRRRIRMFRVTGGAGRNRTQITPTDRPMNGTVFRRARLFRGWMVLLEFHGECGEMALKKVWDARPQPRQRASSHQETTSDQLSITAFSAVGGACGARFHFPGSPARYSPVGWSDKTTRM